MFRQGVATMRVTACSDGGCYHEGYSVFRQGVSTMRGRRGADRGGAFMKCPCNLFEVIVLKGFVYYVLLFDVWNIS